MSSNFKNLLIFQHGEGRSEQRLTWNSMSVHRFLVAGGRSSQLASSSPDEQSTSPSHCQAVVKHTFSPVQLNVPVGHSSLPHPISSSPPAQSFSPSHFQLLEMHRLAVPLKDGHWNSSGAHVPLPTCTYKPHVTPENKRKDTMQILKHPITICSTLWDCM